MADGYAGVRQRSHAAASSSQAIGGTHQPAMFDTPLATGDNFFPDQQQRTAFEDVPVQSLPVWTSVGDSIQVAVQSVDRLLPTEGEMVNGNGRVGRVLMRHRKRLVCFLTAGFALLALLVIVAFGLWLVRLLHVRAPGVEMYQVDDAGGVRLRGSGARVLNVVEPVRPMWSVEQAVLLLDDTEALRNYSALTRERLSLGYLSWHVAHERPRANFTLDGWHAAAHRYAVAEHSTCLCMASFGLPYNGVYVASRNATLYEPRVVQAFDNGRHVMVRTSCAASELLAEARGAADERPEKVRTPASGIVGYLAYDSDTGEAHGGRSTYDVPDFPCIQHCISLFFDSVLDAA